LSTKITKSPRAGFVLVESQALKLSQAIAGYQMRQTLWLIDGLSSHGFTDLTPPHVTFIAALDCDDNFASEIARRLNLSRQAIHKTVRELTDAGYIETKENAIKRNSKIIQITKRGEELISLARQMYAEIDRNLQDRSEPKEIERLIEILGNAYG
jgi:DNA-binding MarR family transcriptional regulator